MQENRLPGERPDRTQPPGYRSEPHLDFIVTDLDGMLAQLCGPDRKIIRLRDKRGIYLFLIEITAITKYLADADGGSRRILRSRPDCWSGISEICWNIDSQVLRADRRSRRPGLGGARLRRPLRRSARSDRVAGAAGTRHDLNCVPPYIEIPYLKSSLASLYCDSGNLYHVNADLSICGPTGHLAMLIISSTNLVQPDPKKRRTAQG